VAGTWYHATAVFDTLGNEAVGDPDPRWSDQKMVSGEMRLYLDGALIGKLAAIKNGWGDSAPYAMSVGRLGYYNMDSFGGLIYNPEAYLGVVPEPSTAVLSTLGALFGLLCYAWKKRR
jgi:hypothetical protein